MLYNLLFLVLSLFLLVQGAIWATKYSALLAENFRLSKYIIGLIVIAVISILPESLVAINSSLEGLPEFGLGSLFGSNVADLSLVFAAILLFSGKKKICIESKILHNNNIYPFFLLIPVVLGLDGYYSRSEGAVLIIVGLIFYYFAFKNGLDEAPDRERPGKMFKNIAFLLISLAALLVGSHFTVSAAAALANSLNITPLLIAMFVVGIGTTLPELFFSLRALRDGDDSLAVGDILGTVLADATIVVGILAMINPFFFPGKIVYVTGVFMIFAAFLLSYFMRTEKIISRWESVFLLLFWVTFALTEYFLAK